MHLILYTSLGTTKQQVPEHQWWAKAHRNLGGHFLGRLRGKNPLHYAYFDPLSDGLKNALNASHGEGFMFGVSMRSIMCCVRRFLCGLLLLSLIAATAVAQSGNPIKVGFSAQLTGALASSGNANLLAQQIWAEEVNARGGLLNRPVELVFYDDQTNASLAPGIYAKLLDVDKVDLLMGAATNIIVAAMPLIIERNKLVMTLVALGVNDAFHYPRYFQSASWGPNARSILSESFFASARGLDPKPQTVALVGADAEFSGNVLEGARANAKQSGLRIVYDKTYPPNTTDFAPVIRAIAATSPDLVFIASYPLDSVGLIRAARELGLKTRLIGGGMVGLQYASIKSQLGENLNGVVNYELWAPGSKMQFPVIEEFLKKYQARAREKGADQIGYYQPPFAYAAMQVLEQAITATGSLDDGKLADYIHGHTFKTIVGDLAFDERGEWATPRVLQVQFRDISGNGLDQFIKGRTQVILYPAEYKDGELRPFAK
jgi:branched-chain amino acid transport system substrate-binding protein